MEIWWESRLEIVLSKSLVRTRLYFPGMDKKIEDIVRILCQANRTVKSGAAGDVPVAIGSSQRVVL